MVISRSITPLGLANVIPDLISSYITTRDNYFKAK